MRGLRQVMSWAVVVVLAGCGDGISPRSEPTPDNPLSIGQDDFVTLERDYYSSRGGEADAFAAGAGGGAGTAAPSENAKAPSGREGTVEEADIYRVDSNRLFYLNTYRGFIIYDLADPKNPQRVSRLPVHGYPIEMFVSGNTVFALLRDALYVTQDATGLKFKRHNLSQLVTIDITNLAAPKVLDTIDIVGELKEGVSRKIDDTIYVVSHIPQSYYYRGYPYSEQRTEQAWVYSFNVANPQAPVLKGKLKIFEGGGYSNYTGGSSSSRWFSSVAISATSNTLHVVENWYTYGWVSGSRYSCGSYRSMQEAVVSIIDISDPTGEIRLHSRFSTYGALTDQFKHTYVYDENTEKGYYLGIFARQEWGSLNCSGSMFVQNALEAWDVTDGANPVRVSTLAFGKPNETVRGTAFDTDRSVAFAITAQRIDPLYAISYADPKNLKVLSEIDGLSGDMNVFRLIGGGKFLVGIGRDNSETCTGYGNPTVGWAANVAVSIIDVQDLAAIRLVQRRCVTVNNASWVNSEINWNLDQAHKMIGMHSDARASVISVPVSYYAKQDPEDGWWWWYRPESAVGLMSFDLAAYDPTKDHLNQTVLKNHGTVVHPNGHVRRSIVFTHEGVTDRRMMVNLSDTHVSVVDIDDLDSPQGQSVIEVAPRHQRLYRFGNYVVDEIQQGSDYGYWSSSGASEFRVKPAAKGLDEAAPVATFTVSRVRQVVQLNDLLVMFRLVEDANVPYYDRESEALVYDLSDPTQPKLASTVKVPTPTIPYVWFGCGNGWGYWPYGYGSSWAASATGLGILTTTYKQYSQEQSLVFLDLANPAAPAVNKKVLATQTYDPQYGYRPTGRQYLSLVGDGQGLVATFKEQVGSLTIDGVKFAVFRNYAERFDGSLNAAAPVNIPGRLIRAWQKNGVDQYLVSDERFTSVLKNNQQHWVPEGRLHLLARSSPTRATLLDTLSLDGLQLGDMVGDADRLFLTLRKTYWYWYGMGPEDSSQDTGDVLTVLDLGQGKLEKKFSASVGTYSSQLMGLAADRLFVNLPGDGVLAVDVSDLSAPVGQHFVRTLGWATHLAITGSTAFIAAGNFGVYELDLATPPSIQVL